MIRLDGRHFKDENGRTLILRGVNLGGSSKVPTRPDGATWNRDGFYDHRNVSFIGRPFPLEDADSHLARLWNWGFRIIRLPVTWEAIEHAGPGIYDEEYLGYLREVIQKAGEHGLMVIIDAHQDAWSRFCGGDGAPGWTLAAAGLELTHLHACGAAFLHQESGDPYPTMIWPTNYNKLAAATMFTLFFAGNDFTPQTLVDGIQIQDYLQTHYIRAFHHLAERLASLANVIGYDIINEPSPGYIGMPDLNRRLQTVGLLKGPTPAAFQSMVAGAGIPQEVDIYDLGMTGFVRRGRQVMNPGGVSAWSSAEADIWQNHSVWRTKTDGSPELIKPDHFQLVNSRQVHFHEDYYIPFLRRFINEVRGIVPDTIFFLEAPPADDGLTWDPDKDTGVVHAGHWYDGLTLISKHYTGWFTIDQLNLRPALGYRAVKQVMSGQIARIFHHSREKMGGIPTLIGETGIPFDMDHKLAYRTGNFYRQEQAMDATLSAMDRNLASYTLWNYTADNSNARGDLWNDEDFSIYSADQARGDGTRYDGGRASRAIVRPYALKTAGEPVSMKFDMKSGRFEYTFRHDPGIDAPTEIFVPLLHYPQGCRVEISDGKYELQPEAQRMFYYHSSEQPAHLIKIQPK